MSDPIIVALITGAFSFIGVVLTCWMSMHKTKEDIKEEFHIAQAVTDTKIEELTREVREHNNFARRMPVVENDIKHIREDEKHLAEDIRRLQSYHNQ